MTAMEMDSLRESTSSPDPLATQPTTTRISTKLANPRKRPSSPSSQTHHQQKRTAAPSTETFTFSSGAVRTTVTSVNHAIRIARDALIQAADIASSHQEQTNLLDLLEILRDYTESGRVTRVGKSFLVANPTKQTNESSTTPSQKQGKPMTYARAAQTNTPASPLVPSSPTASKPFTTVTGSKAWSKKSQKEDLRKRQLVLITSEEDRNQPINSLALRNQINQKFATTAKTPKPVVASITKSHGKQNIILTTTEDFDADFLNKHKEVWKPLFKFTREQKIENWAQIVAHGVPFEPVFLGEDGATALKDEIETFNDISVVGRVRWLSKARRENQRSGSIVFAVASEEIRSAILKRHRITIAGGTAAVVKYLPATPSAQCGRCQRFGHATDSCRRTACRLCAAPHKTGEHQCSSCNTIGRPCEHTVAKCINCKGTHFANSKDCEVWKTAKNIHRH